MKNIDEFVQKVNERIETCNGLVNETRSATNELYVKAKSNFDTLCKGRLEILGRVLNQVYSISDKAFSEKNCYYSVDVNGDVLMADRNGKFWGITCSFYQESNYSVEDVNILYKRFGTEEKALASLGEIEGLFCAIFDKQIERLDGINQGLVDTLQELTSMLKKSSCVEEKEDGKVEIHLNGKTYVGTVKEECE